MTPQLQQAIKMLRLSNIELTDFVEAEIEQNPLLERGEREGDDAAPNPDPDAEAAAANGAPAALPEVLAGDRAAEAADHWRAAAGAEGDGTVEMGGDLGGDPQARHSRNGAGRAGRPPGNHQTPARPRPPPADPGAQNRAGTPLHGDRGDAFYHAH